MTPEYRGYVDAVTVDRRLPLLLDGGGDPVSGHRCPGEPATVRLLADLARPGSRAST